MKIPLNRVYVIAILGICINFNQTLFAQLNAEVIIKGEEFKMKSKSIPAFITGYDSSGYDIVYNMGKFGQRESILFRFDENLFPTGQELPLYPGFSDKVESIKFIIKGDSLYHFFMDHDNNQRKVYRQIISLSSYNVISKAQTIHEVYSKSDDLNNLFFTAMYSPETNNLIILHETEDPSNEFTKINLTRINVDTFHKVEESYTIPIDKKDAVLFAYIQNPIKGIFYVLLKNLENNTLFKKEKDQFNIYSLYNNTLSEISSFTMDTKWNQYKINYVGTDTLVVTGLYSNYGNFNTGGIHFKSINLETGQASATQYYQLPQTIFTNYLRENASKRFKKLHADSVPDLQNYILKDLSIIGGEYYLTSEVHYINNYVDIRRDFLIVKLDGTGTLKWAFRIPKLISNSNGLEYLGFETFEFNNRLLLVYNGNSDNQYITHENPQDFHSMDRSKRIFYGTLIQPNGEYKQNILTQLDISSKQSFMPAFSRLLNDEQLLLFSRRQNESKVQAITLLKIQTED